MFQISVESGINPDLYTFKIEDRIPIITEINFPRD